MSLVEIAWIWAVLKAPTTALEKRGKLRGAQRTDLRGGE